MMKLLLSLSIVLTMSNIYNFRVTSLEGDVINFADFKGKKILIVNTASKCGFTPQYEELEQLHKQYQDRLVIIGFPANDFKGQEPGTNEEIKEFCTRNYGVTFLMAEKVSVIGQDAHPLFQYLVKEAQKLGYSDPIKWNFTKFLLDEHGNLVKVFPSITKPMSNEITSLL